MAGSMTDTWEKKVLDFILRDTTMGLHATNLWLALFTAVPSDNSTGTEVSTSGTAYARAQITRSPAGSATFAASTGTGAGASTSVNTPVVNFNTATASWGTIVGFGICNSLAGSLATDLIYWSDTTSKTVSSGDIASFQAGQITVGQD